MAHPRHLEWVMWEAVSFSRHAGLVPASTVPQAQRALPTWNLGPRNKSGVTKKEVGRSGYRA